MIVQAAAKGDVPCPVWQHLAKFSDECYEVRFVVALKMRQVATIEGHDRNYSAIKDGEAVRKVRRIMRIVPKQERVAADAAQGVKLVRNGKANGPESECVAADAFVRRVE